MKNKEIFRPRLRQVCPCKVCGCQEEYMMNIVKLTLLNPITGNIHYLCRRHSPERKWKAYERKEDERIQLLAKEGYPVIDRYTDRLQLGLERIHRLELASYALQKAHDVHMGNDGADLIIRVPGMSVEELKR